MIQYHVKASRNLCFTGPLVRVIRPDTRKTVCLQVRNTWFSVEREGSDLDFSRFLTNSISFYIHSLPYVATQVTFFKILVICTYLWCVMGSLSMAAACVVRRNSRGCHLKLRYDYTILFDQFRCDSPVVQLVLCVRKMELPKSVYGYTTPPRNLSE